MPTQADLRDELTRHILARRHPEPIMRVGIDGVDGAGKTHLADRLAAHLRERGLAVVRASVDGFHHPRRARYQRGRDSPEGFYRDSYDYDALHDALLEPLAPGGSRRYRTATFDHRADEPVDVPVQEAPPGAILILDGIFLHRPELCEVWDLSVSLRVSFATSVPRGNARFPELELSDDPTHADNRRYVEGQRLYMRERDPEARADVVVDYEDLGAPRIVSAPDG